MFNMVRSKVIRVNKSLYVGIPVEEARRLNLHEGQDVEVEVRALGATWEELRKLVGKYKGQFAKIPDNELWGEPL